MRILLISRGIPSKQDPMWGNFELDQAKALQEKGHKVVTLSIDCRIRLYKRKIGVEHRNIDGIDMYNIFFPLPYRFLPHSIYNKIVDFLAIKLYKKIVESEDEFDLIHAHYLSNIRIAAILKEKYNIPIVGTEHWSALKQNPIARNVLKNAAYAYPRVDRLITVSTPLQNIIKKRFGVDSTFVGCVVDNVFECRKNKQDVKEFEFIAVGTLLNVKGFDLLIEAFAKADFEKKIKLRIVGGGRLMIKLQRQINALGMQQQIFLEGRKQRTELVEYLSKSSAFVLSSRSENFATACVEALSVGVPVVMAKCGGPEGFVNESNGILVSANDVEELADGMIRMYNNIHKYDANEISKDIKKRFSAESIATQLEEIYCSILS